MAWVLLANRLARWLSLVALVSALAAPAAHAQDASGVDSISAEYHDLLDLFYRPLDPHDLLQAGWTALSADATRHGAAAPGALPDLPADANGALDAFTSAYTTYVASLPASFSPS